MPDIPRNYSVLFPKLVSGLIVVGILLAALFFYWRHQQANNPERELENIIQTISQTFELPPEVPTLATVTNKALLEEQEFFKLAQNGDKVLIYRGWRKIILYRPSTKKIIDIAAINAAQAAEAELSSAFNESSPTPLPSPIPTPTPLPSMHRVALYNGTTINGLTQTVSDQLASESQVTITARQNAAQSNYTQTFVIPLKETSRTMADSLAQVLSAQVSLLPAGEILPEDADILIILGTPDATPSATTTPLIRENSSESL